MLNPFKKIIEHQNVPEIIRERVMSDIRLIKLYLDMADLMAVKYPSSVINLLDATLEDKKNENKNSDEK
ncbi:MAG: hypothetical protein PHO74_01870 [Weeksellaceae bacterium]|jgi:hypothetical protein|nr:hypothetical protein [Weeksellaceae bacterium]